MLYESTEWPWAQRQRTDVSPFKYSCHMRSKLKQENMFITYFMQFALAADLPLFIWRCGATHGGTHDASRVIYNLIYNIQGKKTTQVLLISVNILTCCYSFKEQYVPLQQHGSTLATTVYYVLHASLRPSTVSAHEGRGEMFS